MDGNVFKPPTGRYACKGYHGQFEPKYHQIQDWITQYGCEAGQYFQNYRLMGMTRDTFYRYQATIDA